jgi:hypothetical protein
MALRRSHPWSSAPVPRRHRHVCFLAPLYLQLHLLHTSPAATVLCAPGCSGQVRGDDVLPLLEQSPAMPKFITVATLQILFPDVCQGIYKNVIRQRETNCVYHPECVIRIGFYHHQQLITHQKKNVDFAAQTSMTEKDF